jgi:hypothetical protein
MTCVPSLHSHETAPVGRLGRAVWERLMADTSQSARSASVDMPRAMVRVRVNHHHALKHCDFGRQRWVRDARRRAAPRPVLAPHNLRPGTQPSGGAYGRPVPSRIGGRALARVRVGVPGQRSVQCFPAVRNDMQTKLTADGLSHRGEGRPARNLARERAP